MHRALGAALVCLAACSTTDPLEAVHATDNAAWVDPFVGTEGDHGQLSPAATVPFGMVKLGPDSAPRGQAGYDHGSSQILGFSHTRIEGVGCKGAGGDVRVLPIEGDRLGAAAEIVPGSERASPGYYASELYDGQDGSVILAEMTSTQHAGVHRYTFPAGGLPNLRMSFNDPFQPVSGAYGGHVEIRSEGREIEGWVAGRNVCSHGSYRLFFSAALSQRPDYVLHDIAGAPPDDLLIAFEPVREGEGEQTILLKVGLSSVSAEAARRDRDREVPGWDFDEVVASARARWDEQLGQVQIEGGTDEDRRLFYTMLYRASMSPVDITTGDGAYRGTDGAEHDATGYRHYHSWSIWDTYRTKYPLLALVDPVRMSDIGRSLVDLYLEGKVDWAGQSEPYPTVRTERAVVVLLDAYARGIRDIPVAEVLDLIEADVDGFHASSPDLKLEKSYDQWAVARLARLLGDSATHRNYLTRSAAYRETWRRWFLDLAADQDADEMHAHGMYEGTPWQYRWAVPHDIHGLIDMLGGPAAFDRELERFFVDELYNHANEPDLHAAYLFHYVGKPWRTQELVHRILTEPMNHWYRTHEKRSEPFYGRAYRLHPRGMIPEMDDDAGTMSSWYVLAAMGLFPAVVGQPIYHLSSPLFEEISIAASDGRTFTIRCENHGPGNDYIQSASLNGEPLERAWIWHEELTNGGELVLVMGDEPNRTWATSPAASPPPAFE